MTLELTPQQRWSPTLFLDPPHGTSFCRPISKPSHPQGKYIWEESIQSRVDIRKCPAVPSERWDQAAIAKWRDGHEHIGTGTEGGQNLSHLHFPSILCPS